MEWENAGIVKASQHRQTILKMLKEQGLTPNDIAQTLKLHLSQVTRNLREMEQRGLVECKTPQLRKGRIYTITEKGINILEKINLG